MPDRAANAALQELADLTARLADAVASDKLRHEYAAPWTPTTPGPYKWQMEFHAAGATHSERCVLAANRVGKSLSAAAETAIHLTGLYPKWWTGRLFPKPVSWLILEPTNLLCRKIAQPMMIGKIVEGSGGRTGDGTGWIPRARIKDVTFRQCGLSNVVDVATVAHVSGGSSEVAFQSYESGATTLQGFECDGVWMDEEPETIAEAWTIYSELLTRLLTRRGMLMFTRTPLYGMSEIVRHFVNGGAGIWKIGVTWADVPHLDETAKAQLLESYAEHERDTRTKGVPMLGSGAVYPVNQVEYVVEPFVIPQHWRRIAGVDFGIGHPAAGAWLAHDADADVVYVYDAYKMAGQTPVYHADAINTRGRWIPVAWPHDGMVRDKGSGRPIRDVYEEKGANMLPNSARYADDQGGPQSREVATGMILERMRTKRFFVFSHLADLLEEFRMLHRKDGVIQQILDDTESACRYAMMMLRCAVSGTESREKPQETTDVYDPFEVYQ